MLLKYAATAAGWGSGRFSYMHTGVGRFPQPDLVARVLMQSGH